MIQIAFAGHNRPDDLGSREAVSDAIAAAFDMIKQSGVAEARLLTGLAAGADELAVAAWKPTGLGPVHAVLPFLGDPDSDKVGPGLLAETATWLDGASTEAEGRNPHLKQTRVIVEAADLVVVVWTGGAARGAGGTADAVLCALELGLPVLWIKPSEPHPLRIIRPERLPSDFHFPEFQEALFQGRLDHVALATPENLWDSIDHPIEEVEDDHKREHKRGRKAPAKRKPPGRFDKLIDDVLHGTLWRTYATFRKAIGGQVPMATRDVPIPPSLLAQPGFALLTEAYVKADRVANRLSAVHRSELILLVLAMIAAGVVGSAPAIWSSFKITAIWIELALSGGAMVVWATASDSRQHERWGEQRFMAEQLRLDRAGWAIGIGISGAAPASAGLRSGSERETLRAAGLPQGKFDAERVRSWGEWAMNELVYGQAAYHRSSSVREGRIADRVRIMEDVSFVFLFVVFAGYVAASAWGMDEHVPHWTAGIVTMTGTVVPAFASASMALEAKLDFQEQSSRSRRIAIALEDLETRLGSEPSYDTLQDIGRTAVRLHLAESSHWREGADRRRLFRL